VNSPKALIQPEECTLLLIDQQAGLAFGVASIDRQVSLSKINVRSVIRRWPAGTDSARRWLEHSAATPVDSHAPG